MENSFPASRGDNFPAGLRVLVVDDDPTWLKILEKMLHKCSYEVTTCGLARVALDLLRERREKFDIVISDVNMPDMDGFKLLEQVGLEMDLPVIMMSVDGETSRVMKGVQHGACDYLLKPVRMKELKNIWQHVLRKKIHEVKEIENQDINGYNHMENRLEEFDEKHILSRGDAGFAKKRKDLDSKEHIEQNFTDAASVKRARVVWSVDLHQKFVNAVNQIGFDKVGPKKILDLMNVPGLTRENVASHLQKYRLYLSRLQKQNEEVTFFETEQSDPRFKYSPGIFSLQNSIAIQGGNTPDNYGLFAKGLHLKDMIPKISEDHLIERGSIQATETIFLLNNPNSESENMSNVSRFGPSAFSDETIPGLDYKRNEICISEHKQSGYRGSRLMQSMQLVGQGQESLTLKRECSQLQQAGKHHQFEDVHLHTPTPIYSIISSVGDSSSPSSVIPLKFNSDSVSQIERSATGTNFLEAASRTDSSPSPESYSPDYKNGLSCLEPMTQKVSVKTEVDLAFSDDLSPCFLQSYGFFEDIALNGFGVWKDNQTETDIRSIIYDELQYNCEYLFDLLEVPMIDDGLFI
ncbi:hypothetical protein Taro_031541 [Colocasia esculenta]|uniref:Response regulatory domain-containing protein n=1 Tax=Colocasia esculenta TaxID=4460 RepID=A0A843VJ26_COLES|nr:hypothetical protein [Colocasia esculenta]